MNTTTSPLTAAAEKQSTATLLGARMILDAKPWTELTNEERMVAASIADVITERHGLDALLDEIYMDLEFTGTYSDALVIAMAKAGVEV